MPLIAVPTLVKQRFRFVVEVGAGGAAIPAQPGGIVRALFRNCSELSQELAKSEIFHSGSIVSFKMPGRLTTTDVTLEAGATSDGSLFGWFLQAAAAVGGGAGFVFKRLVTIVEKDRGGQQLNRWNLASAFPTKFMAGEWDNESDDFTIESVTLAYDFFAPLNLSGTPVFRDVSALASQL